MTFEKLLSLVNPTKSLRICSDSRFVRRGDVFVALKGTVYDGHDFIDKAVEAGAKYIVSQKLYDCDNAEVIIVEDSSKAAALLAQKIAGNPASKLTNLAVTGTNGKTTVAFLVQSVINTAGLKCGLIGTVQYDTGQNVTDAPLTTPDAFTIAKNQKQMIDAGMKFMIIEASSHALSQNRLTCIDFKAAAFTNLTGDHLDYHKTEKKYLAAKTILFEELAGDAAGREY